MKHFILKTIIILSIVSLPYSIQAVTKEKFQEIKWESLVPDGFSFESIMQKYQVQAISIQDGTEESIKLFQKITEEMNNAPVNQKMDQQKVKIPGYIAPLKVEKLMIYEFLLVPYFGQCIHSPPPPVNQTILVRIDKKKGKGISTRESIFPFWVLGKLKVEKEKTDIGTAGYVIENAIVEKYEPPKKKKR